MSPPLLQQYRSVGRAVVYQKLVKTNEILSNTTVKREGEEAVVLTHEGRTATEQAVTQDITPRINAHGTSTFKYLARLFF